MNCPNCGAPATGNYCAACGQARKLPAMTLGGFVRDSTQELANWDGKVPSTLRTLLTRPGQLTVDLLAGRRARWLTPLRVYLICSLAFFAVRPLLLTLTDRSPRDFAQINPALERTATGDLTPASRELLASGMPGRIFGVDRLERALRDPQQFNRELDTAFPNAMFLLLPAFALLTSLIWRRQLRHYPPHLYLALHLHAAVFAALTVFWILASITPWRAVAMIAFVLWAIYLLWYSLTTFRHVFGQSWVMTIVKAAVAGVVYVCLLYVVTIALLAWALLRT